MVKNDIKSFVRENNFHTYLTRETLPAEERVSKFHNHETTSSSLPLLLPLQGRRFCESYAQIPPAIVNVLWRNDTVANHVLWSIERRRQCAHSEEMGGGREGEEEGEKGRPAMQATIHLAAVTLTADGRGKNIKFASYLTGNRPLTCKHITERQRPSYIRIENT